MNREILIELVSYIPSLHPCLGNSEKEILLRLISLSSVHLFEWEQDILTHRAVDIVKLACKEGEDWVVYEILDQLGYDNEELVDFVAITAKNTGREELFGFMVDKGYNDDIQIYRKRRKSIFAWMVEAVKNNDRDAVERILSNGYVALDSVVYMSAKYGNREIVSDYINSVVDWNKLATNAAQGGLLDLVDYCIDQGAVDIDGIARAAALGGHDEIVRYAIEGGPTDINAIARIAASNGWKRIVLMTGVDPSTLNYFTHEDAAQYFTSRNE